MMRPSDQLNRPIGFGRFAMKPALGLVLLSAANVEAHGISERDLNEYVNGGWLVYVKLGASHMLTGYDHLLFLFGVIFPLTRLHRVILFVTAFTLGHSITLILATFFQIQANPFLIDAVIALSVCYKAFDNLDGFRRFIDVTPPNLLTAIFVFGLVHGFGLSTRLQQLPLGHQQLCSRIFSFNLGVEVGQIAALTVVAALLASWRRTPSFATFGKLANATLLAAGALLWLFQLHGYIHSARPEDFPFNEHEHAHLHEEAAEPGPKRALAP